MRTKMSPRRAMATAAIMAVVPIGIFFGGMNRLSENICDQLLDKTEISLEQKVELETNCNQVIKDSHWRAFYWVLFASIVINWPVIRWMDDWQWYQEWIKKKRN